YKYITDTIDEYKYKSKKLSTTGGLLKEVNTTLMIGCEDEHVDTALNVIRENSSQREQVVAPISSMGGNADTYISKPIKVEVGGATVFIMPIEAFHQF